MSRRYVEKSKFNNNQPITIICERGPGRGQRSKVILPGHLAVVDNIGYDVINGLRFTVYCGASDAILFNVKVTDDVFYNLFKYPVRACLGKACFVFRPVKITIERIGPVDCNGSRRPPRKKIGRPCAAT